MVPRETVLFSESPDIRTRGKTKLVSRGTIHWVLCYIFRLSLNQTYSKNKQTKKTAGNKIWIWPGARDQESTNHSSCFVEWKSSYITVTLIQLSKRLTIPFLFLFKSVNSEWWNNPIFWCIKHVVTWHLALFQYSKRWNWLSNELLRSLAQLYVNTVICRQEKLMLLIHRMQHFHHYLHLDNNTNNKADEDNRKNYRR